MWLTAKQDLRINLSDGPTDRYRFRQRVFGELNGSNTRFKSFDMRRVTDFTITEGVYLNGVLQATSYVSQDCLLTGEFIVTTPPIDGDLLEASFFSQWFLDAELEDFLVQASRWLFSSQEYTNVPDGLIGSALAYAQSRAYLKLSIKWKDYLSSGYRVEDAPQKEASAMVTDFVNLSKAHLDDAEAQRKQFYTRQDQNLQPLFGTVRGFVRSMP